MASDDGPEAAPARGQEDSATAGRTVIVVREGCIRKPTQKNVGHLALSVVGSLVFLLPAFAALQDGLSGRLFVAAVAGAAIVLLALGAGTAGLMLRLSRLTVSIGDEEASVLYGPWPPGAVTARASAAAVEVGVRQARVRSAEGRLLLKVPMPAHHAEIREALWTHGWPTVDVPAGGRE